MGLKSQSYLPICFENQTDGELDFERPPGSGGGSGSGVGIFIYLYLFLMPMNSGEDTM